MSSIFGTPFPHTHKKRANHRKYIFRDVPINSNLIQKWSYMNLAGQNGTPLLPLWKKDFKKIIASTSRLLRYTHYAILHPPTRVLTMGQMNFNHEQKWKKSWTKGVVFWWYLASWLKWNERKRNRHVVSWDTDNKHRDLFLVKCCF